jgi:peptide-methionine (S)-S-oxide reductase
MFKILVRGFCAAALAGVMTAATLPDPATDEEAKKGTESIVLAGGCFWGVEGVFERIKGVKDAVSGYAGGKEATAHYEVVSTGRTGHAESVKVTYDPSQITLGQLLKVYFAVAHDPTELNRQGPDEGTQYRSAIFYSNPEQQRVADAYIAQLNEAKTFHSKIVTQVVPLPAFYAAEEHHQHFLDRNPNYPYIVYNDMPKIKALQKQFPQLCKK